MARSSVYAGASLWLACWVLLAALGLPSAVPAASVRQTESELKSIREQIEMGQAWADQHHLPVYMGEFGVIKNADAKSRETWLRMTRMEAEKHGFGWAYWDDGGHFMAYDRGAHSWVPYLKAALLQ